ncbi:MAG: JAB domain-containing protein, partial [Lachnospiraceae bacterium]|nr:JAB domain-containing protein [Lachnospiraceae bacterium]
MAESNAVYKLDQVAIRMVKEPPLYSTDPMDSPEAAARLLSDFLRDYDREVFCVVALDARLRPININIASMGTLNASLVHPREVFKA